MFARSFDNLDDVIREARVELGTYRKITAISDRAKRPEPEKEFTKDKKDYSQSASSFKKKGEANSISGATFSPYKKSGPSGVKDDLKDVECYKCHKKGHYANKCPEIKDTKGPLKVRKMEEGNVSEDPEKKSIRQIQVFLTSRKTPKTLL